MSGYRLCSAASFMLGHADALLSALLHSVMKGLHVQVYVDTVGDAALYQERLAKRYPGIRHARPRCSSLYMQTSVGSAPCDLIGQAITCMALLIEGSTGGPAVSWSAPRRTVCTPSLARLASWPRRAHNSEAAAGCRTRSCVILLSSLIRAHSGHAHVLQVCQCLGVELDLRACSALRCSQCRCRGIGCCGTL